jgi:hypothetical protein
MDTSLIIGIGISVVTTAGVLYKHPLIERIINKKIDGLSPFQTNLIFGAIVILTLAVPSLIGYSASPEKTNQVVHNTTTTVEAEKNDYEAGAIAVEKLAGATQSIISAQERKDSIIRASKDQLWVFQIGVHSDMDAASTLYKKVQHIGNVNVFELPKRNFFVYQKTGADTKTELEKTLPELKAQLREIETDISIIDLAKECRTRKDVTQDTKGKFQRKHPEIPCFTCK